MTTPAPTDDLIQALNLDDPATLSDFDMLARAACMLTGAANAFVSFADSTRLWPASALAARSSHKPLEQAYCSALLAGDEDNLVSRDVRQDPRTRAITRQPGDTGIVAYAGALLRTEDGRKLGTLCVTDTVQRDFDTAQVELLNGLARQVMNLVALRAAKRELTDALATMTELARTDALTGLLNRAAWHEEAGTLHRLVQRQAGALTLVMLDLDHFKRINDSHGHAAGDAVLREVGRLLRSELRTTDRVGRIGGEEFAIAMPFTTAQAAASRIERLRERIAAQPVAHGTQGGQRIAVTVSGGVAPWREGDRTLEAALRRADAALYRAKASGRNRVLVEEARSSGALQAA